MSGLLSELSLLTARLTFSLSLSLERLRDIKWPPPLQTDADSLGAAAVASSVLLCGRLQLYHAIEWWRARRLPATNEHHDGYSPKLAASFINNIIRNSLTVERSVVGRLAYWAWPVAGRRRRLIVLRWSSSDRLVDIAVNGILVQVSYQ